MHTCIEGVGLISNNKIFSIIIPTLNEEGKISQLIQSIFHQSYRPIEIILVDGGSKDKTLEIVSSLKSQLENETFSVKIIHENTNPNQIRSPANARNLGVEQSRGKYILFLDADIMLLSKHFLQKTAQDLESYRFVFFKVKIIADNWLERNIGQPPRGVLPAFRREVFSFAKFDVSLGFREDADFLDRLRDLGVKQRSNAKYFGEEIGLHEQHTLEEYTVRIFWYGRTLWPYIRKHPKESLFLLLPACSFWALSFAFLYTLIDFKVSLLFLSIFVASFLYLLCKSPHKTLDRLAFLLLQLSYVSLIWFVGSLVGIIEYLRGVRNLGRRF